MKKYLFVGLILFVLFSITSCNGKTYVLKNPVDEIASIEIVSAENSLEYTVTKTLSEKEKNEFIEKFPTLRKHPIVPHCYLYNKDEFD